ncbi:HTH-type transcriptional regulator GltC [Streptomyces sp. RB5]|uniref:HTH-type transcriptional regulator GltC n=1 Tax=Streptomyces smaragdinus TaxID=2585196 RepID=A0A7K0CPE9_9ACTN|nr:LysR family transcriptional regulator [Streptomyces smaragdinus]MQY15355.1 HTH-type transcriptional regulator GltC [Streptomyces smaragdinus]
MDTGWLEVFRAVARHGSFTAAGAELGFTQSAVSRQIAALEAEFGAPLFDRLPRGVRLTEQGQVALAHAEAALDRLGAARRDLAALRDVHTGRLRLGSFATAGAALVPRTLAAFREAHPGVTVSHTEGFSRTHVAALAAGELDLAVVSGYAEDLDAFEAVELTRLLDEPVLVALPAGHRLAERRTLRLAELADEPWIAGSASPEDTLISACLRRGFRPRIEVVAREWLAKFGFAAAGFGLTLVPALAAGSLPSGLVLRPLHRDDAPVRTVLAATPRGTSRPPAVRAFLPLLREAARELES